MTTFLLNVIMAPEDLSNRIEIVTEITLKVQGTVDCTLCTSKSL